MFFLLAVYNLFIELTLHLFNERLLKIYAQTVFGIAAVMFVRHSIYFYNYITTTTRSEGGLLVVSH